MREYKDKECSNCKETKKIAAKGLCRRCYSRLQRNGHLEKVKVKNVCEVDGCDKFVVTHGLCDKHRKRMVRHGHLESTRAHDWGDREKHPLYQIWTGHRRYKEKHNLCEEWHKDFWLFVKFIKERPTSNHHLKPINIDYPIGINNWHWVESVRAELNDEDKKAYQREWCREDRKRNPDKYKDKMLKRSYGIDLDEYNEMLEQQGHVCAICKCEETALNPNTGNPRDMAVDHCHRSGKVRGVLCTACNTAIGLLKDDKLVVYMAYGYLEKHGNM